MPFQLALKYAVQHVMIVFTQCSESISLCFPELYFLENSANDTGITF